MSLRAIIWVLEESGITEHGDFRLMIALADRADNEGRDCYPTISWLAERMERSDRMVRRGLKRLLDQGYIVRGDQEKVSHYRSDRRPVVYNIVMARRDNPDVSERGDTSVTPSASRGDTFGIHGVTPDVLQTVPNSLQELTGTGNEPADVDPAPSPAPKKPTKRAHPLPDDWAPTEAHEELASKLRLDVNHEADVFRDHAVANGRQQKVWDAAFSMWLRNSSKFSGNRAPAPRERGRDPRSGMMIER